MSRNRIFFSLVFLLGWTVNWSVCLTLEFYSRQNYSGLLEKKIVDTKDEKQCIKLDTYYDIKSIKTDKCVMIYETEDCSHYPRDFYNKPKPPTYYSVRVLKNTDHFDIDQAYNYREDDRGVQSLHVCSQELGGGAKLDVDLYDKIYYQGDLLKSWSGLCKCETIPMSINRGAGTFSIDNHGNSINVYSEEHCRGRSQLIPAGDNDLSRQVFTNAFVQNGNLFDVRSFRPAGSLDCIKVDASIYKFIFSNGSDTLQKTEDVQLATTQTLINDGALEMSQTLELSDTITNSVEYSVAKAFTQVHSAGVKIGVATESNAGVPLVMGAKLKTSLEANYQYTNTHSNTETNKTTTTESKTVKISSNIKVKSCEKCDVNGYVKIVRDFPISYVAEATIQGTADEQKLNAEELRAYIPAEMKYIKDYDENTVVVSVDGSMQAEFAWKTFVSKSCQPLVNCKYTTINANHMALPPKPTYEIEEVPFVVV